MKERADRESGIGNAKDNIREHTGIRATHSPAPGLRAPTHRVAGRTDTGVFCSGYLKGRGHMDQQEVRTSLRCECERVRQADKPAFREFLYISKRPNLLVDLDRLSTTWEANKSPKRGAYGLWLCPPK